MRKLLGYFAQLIWVLVNWYLPRIVQPRRHTDHSEMITRRSFSIVAEAAFLAGVNVARAQSAGKIVLGQSAAFTGPAAQLGIQFNRGANVWFDPLNAQGGVGGKTIELHKMDDGHEPDRQAAHHAGFEKARSVLPK